MGLGAPTLAEPTIRDTAGKTTMGFSYLRNPSSNLLQWKTPTTMHVVEAIRGFYNSDHAGLCKFIEFSK